MPKKVLLLTHEYPPTRGGAGIYCEEIAFAATIKKIPVEVWAPKGSIKSCTFNVKELPWKGTHSWISSWKLVSEFLGLKCEVNQDIFLHLAELGSVRAFIRFGWRLKKSPKIIITIHGSELLRFTRNPIEKWLFKRLLYHASRIHVLSKYNEEKLKLFHPDLKNKIILLPGAPARRMILQNEPESSPGNSNSIKILCVGRFHPRKGQALLLRALNQLPAELQRQIEVILAGPFTKSGYLSKIKSQSKNFKGRVIFTGDIHDHALRKQYQKADIFALTSTVQKNSVEGFGFVYLEASAHGLPIVANRIGGVEDTVLENKTGLLAEPNSLQSLSKKLEILATDPKLRAQLGGNGKKWAKSHSWEEITEKLYKFP